MAMMAVLEPSSFFNFGEEDEERVLSGYSLFRHVFPLGRERPFASKGIAFHGKKAKSMAKQTSLSSFIFGQGVAR